MAYDVTLVQFNGSIGGISASPFTGFPFSPTTFDFLLNSMWMCLPADVSRGTAIGIGNGFQTLTPESAQIQMVLRNPLSGTIFSGTYAVPVIGQRYNLLTSVNCQTQTVQVYVNDAPAVLVSGGWLLADSLGQTTPGSLAVDLGSTFGALFPAIADLWMDAPMSFVDLTAAGNRRKFINANLTPVYLGASGSAPFGASPPVYLTVPAAGAPTDFATNFGTGGTLHLGPGISLTFQTPGTCSLPTVPVARPMVSIIGKSAPPP